MNFDPSSTPDTPATDASPPAQPVPAPTAAAPGAASAATGTVSAPRPAGRSKKAMPPAPSTGESIKETLESILVAFILAFVFRAFVVEAYVIPTGSMAPTLLGAHMRFTCDECGRTWDVDPAEPSGPGGEPDIRAFASKDPFVHCQNCGHAVDESHSKQVPEHYGDRILVLKYAYLLESPKRWDVVVFKSPFEKLDKDFTVNFIKRLVALPGEAAMVLDGDVYTLPRAQVVGNEGNDWDKLPWAIQSKPHVVQEALWRVVYDNDFYPISTPEALAEKEAPWNEPWQVGPTPELLRALKLGASADASRVARAYDALDAPARAKLAGWDTGQSAADRRVFHFANLDRRKAPVELLFNRAANPDRPNWRPLTDWLDYNETRHESQSNLSWVSDLKLSFYYHRTEGDGMFTASLTKLGQRFTAQILPGRVRVVRFNTATGAETLIGEAPLPPGGGRDTKVEFQNVDYRVALRIDNQELIASTPEQYGPDLAALRLMYEAHTNMVDRSQSSNKLGAEPAVSIGAMQQRCDISHISLWRDIYYTSQLDGRPLNWANPGASVKLAVKGEPAEVLARQELRNAGQAPRKGDATITVPLDDEYFVLGDNSALSQDARAWPSEGAYNSTVDLLEDEALYSRAGRVPGRFMIGRAFFVYWPAGYRPVNNSMPGLIPNFGDMRFIH